MGRPGREKMVYGRSALPSYMQHTAAPGQSHDAVHVPMEARDVEEPPQDRFAPPVQVANAYQDNNNPLNPMSCFKQANTCIQQQHYLDPKYHGTGSAVAQMIHEKVGDEGTTKRILQTTCVALVTAVVLIVVLTLVHEMHEADQPMGSSQRDVEGPMFKQDDIDELMRALRNPRANRRIVQNFDKKYGQTKMQNLLRRTYGREKSEKLEAEIAGILDDADETSRKRERAHDRGRHRTDRDEKDDKDDDDEDRSIRDDARNAERSRSRHHGKNEGADDRAFAKASADRRAQARAAEVKLNRERQKYRDSYAHRGKKSDDFET